MSILSSSIGRILLSESESSKIAGTLKLLIRRKPLQESAACLGIVMLIKIRNATIPAIMHTILGDVLQRRLLLHKRADIGCCQRAVRVHQMHADQRTIGIHQG